MTDRSGDEDPQYWRATYYSKCLHADRQCQSLKRANNVRPAHPAEIDNAPRCKQCTNSERQCEYCGETYSHRGIGPHEKHCDENPDPPINYQKLR